MKIPFLDKLKAKVNAKPRRHRVRKVAANPDEDRIKRNAEYRNRISKRPVRRSFEHK